MVYLFCLLFVMTSAFAQPDYGPYVIADGQQNLLCGGVDILAPLDEGWQVFYSFGDTAYYTTLDIESGTSEHASILPGSGEGWGRRICDAVWTEGGYWSALCYDSTWQFNRTLLISQRSDLSESVQIDSGRGVATEWFGSSVHGYSFLKARPGGGVFAAWTDYWDHWNGSGYWMDIFGTVYNLPAEATEIYPYEPLYDIGFESRFLIYPADSLSYYTVTDNYETVLSLYEESNTMWSVNLNCEIFPVELLRPQNNRFLLLSEPGYIYQTRVLEFDSTGYCESLNSFDSEIVASAAHTDYGFAWIEQVGHGLQLWRADLNGQPVATEGLIYYHDASSIDKINLNIADDGTIAVIWCESDANGRSIYAAAVDWDTPLSVDDSRSTPIPSSMSLSAYPNPFNSEVTMKYELNQAGNVNLAIYNLAGQEVERLVDGRQNAGLHTVDWTPQGASGIYFAKLTSGHKDCLSKLVYIR